MRFDYNWIWYLDGNMNWEWNLDFLDDWNFNFLVDWHLFNVMVVNCMDVVWDIDLDVFAIGIEGIESDLLVFRIIKLQL